MFDQLRSALKTARDADRSIGDRHAAVAAMRDALVAARLGVDDLRGGLAESRRQLDAARQELETTRRRGRLAADVHDVETVAVADRFAATQAERVGVIEAKVDLRARELALAERELAQMTVEYRRLAATGQMHAAPDDLAASSAEPASPAQPAHDPDALLAALKRRMGK